MTAEDEEETVQGEMMAAEGSVVVSLSVYRTSFYKERQPHAHKTESDDILQYEDWVD